MHTESGEQWLYGYHMAGSYRLLTRTITWLTALWLAATSQHHQKESCCITASLGEINIKNSKYSLH